MTAHPLGLLLMPWGRVGSNMVNAALAGAGAKVFNEPLTGIASRSRGQPREAVAAAQVAWLTETLAPEALDRPTVLNHAALSTADPAAMRDWIAARGARLVTLDRGDDAAVALSSARIEAWIAEGAARGETRNWSIARGVRFTPRIAPGKLLTNLGNVREGRRIMAELVAGRPALHLFYEDLVADMDGAMAALMRHVGLAWRRFDIHTSRFGADSLAQMVANPEELAEVLRADGGRTALLPEHGGPEEAPARRP